MLTRSYGEVDGRFKDGGSVLLMPGESPRTPYPWAAYSSCPHCGSIGRWEQNEEMGHCAACGTWIPREGRVPWRPDGAYKVKRHLRPPTIIVCCDCGEEFETYCHTKMPVRCEKCRMRKRREDERDKQRKIREGRNVL